MLEVRDWKTERIGAGILLGAIFEAHGQSVAWRGSWRHSGPVPKGQNALYHKVTVCQVVDKWFGCSNLKRKKFSVGSTFLQEFISRLYCVR